MDTKTNRSHQQQHTVLFWNTLTFVYNTGWAPSLNVSLTILPEGSCPSFFIFHWYTDLLGFPGDSGGKESPATRETWIQSLGWEEPLEKEMATHSSILAWITPWTEEPGGLQSMRSQRVGQTELLTLSSLYSLSSPICTLTHFQGKVSFISVSNGKSLNSKWGQIASQNTQK